MKSLWGDFNLKEVKTPSSILDEVIKDLKTITKNFVYADLIKSTNNDFEDVLFPELNTEFKFKFLVKSKYMEKYSFEAFSIYHDIIPYPLKIKIDSEIKNSISDKLESLNKDCKDLFISIDSEEEFLKILSFILQSRRMNEIINMLYSLAKENIKISDFLNNNIKKGFIYSGSTTVEAIKFYEECKNEFGEVVEVEMISDPSKAKYILILKNEEDENLIFLGGLTSGYLGEGCRGTQKVLTMAGFDINDKFISSNSSFIISK